MSLLEDVFLQDEANEAEHLERVIEGDEFEERRRSDSDDNSEKEDEAEEDKRRVDPTKPKTTRVTKNPRFLLNPARLTGPRGIQVIPEHFKDFKFKGKGHEKEDLDLVLKKLEHWAYRLYPKFQFEDCLKKIETLGKKRAVAVHFHKIRSDQFLSEDTVVQKDSSDEDTPMPVQEEDEFDKLLQQQIELARSTPAPSSAKKPDFGGTSPPKDNRTTSVMMPKAISSPSINDEQRERMLRNRKLAEERRLARLKNATNTSAIVDNPSTESLTIETEHTEHTLQNTDIHSEKPSISISKDIDGIGIVRKHNRSNVIDSSDEETVETNVAIEVDVHTVRESNAEDNNGVEETENNIDINREIKATKVNVQDESDGYENNTFNNNSNMETNISNKCSILTDKKAVEESNSRDSILHGNRETDSDMNRINPEDLEVTEQNIAETSGDIGTLRYDDSDVNVDLDEQSISDKNGENIITSDGSHFKETPDTSDKNGTENAIAKVCNYETEVNVPEDIIEDIMDVDFSEDF